MGTPPISSAMSRGRGLKVLLRTLFPPALCGYLPSLLLLRNIGETQKKQSFLRKGIRGMKRQSPTNYRLSKFNRITPCFLIKFNYICNYELHTGLNIYKR